MERETKKFIPKDITGIEVEFKTCLTGKEMDEWRSLFLNYFKGDISGKIENVQIDGKLLAEMEKKAIELAIYSVNGKQENILNTILDLPVQGYRQIADEALKIMDEVSKFFASKKK